MPQYVDDKKVEENKIMDQIPEQNIQPSVSQEQIQIPDHTSTVLEVNENRLSKQTFLWWEILIYCATLVLSFVYLQIFLNGSYPGLSQWVNNGFKIVHAIISLISISISFYRKRWAIFVFIILFFAGLIFLDSLPSLIHF